MGAPKGNKYAVGNKGGRPLKFKSEKELKEKCDKFFYGCYYHKDGTERETPLPVTITGLALALGTTRQLLMDYENKEEFHDTIKEAKTKVEMYAEQRLFGNNAAGAIFALKNFGWRDKQELDQKSEITGKDGGPVEQKWKIEFKDVK